MHTPAIHRAGRLVLSITSASFLLLAGVRSPRAEIRSDRPEQILFDSANRERAARGIGPLRWDEALAEAARRHALIMMSRGALSHQFAGELDLPSRVRRTGVRFTAVAENIAEGPSVVAVHQEWMLSAPHRENLLNPELNSLGVAVAERDGELFAVEDFSETVDDVSFLEQEQQIAAQLQSRGLRLLRDAPAENDAHEVCEGRPSRMFGPGRMFSLRYGTADFKTLPSALLRELDGRRYRAAAVGACEPAGNADFSGYQIAVLLYQ